MRQAKVNLNGRFAGILTENPDNSFVFEYQEDYLLDKNSIDVSLTLPKSRAPYRSAYLFPCFSNLLSEGANRALQCKLHRIDIDDDFGLLLATAQYDCIGALTFTPISV